MTGSNYRNEYLPLLGFQGVNWTEKSKFLLANLNKAAAAQVSRRFCFVLLRKHRLVRSYTPPAPSACTILGVHDPLLSGLPFFWVRLLPHH